ncbi:hypothetical protein M9Y10_027001 [Tritrichomonas musculus]|uniref:NADPH-dependent FMN reductase-like domain-containing protein n=1 Tax=Tritrichomonas musculus TaxID=1915356 RepID=A0ABR2H7M1_9EUKA
MIKKVIGFNGSPRKGWNTDLMVQKCLEGAKSSGAEVKLYQIADLKNIKPCISCLSCKRKDPKYQGVCVLKDGLSPILKEIKTADAIVLGSPNYLGYVSAAIHPVLERMVFSNLTYKKSGLSAFGRKIKTAIILTMNATEKQSEQFYTPFLASLKNEMTAIFGDCEILSAYDTLQVEDYSKYELSFFDAEHKKKVHQEDFPKELQQAYELGKRLIS